MECKEIVDLLTDYLEDMVPEPMKHEMDDHFANCPGCEAFFRQYRRTVDFPRLVDTGQVEIPGEVRDRMESFICRMVKEKAGEAERGPDSG